MQAGRPSIYYGWWVLGAGAVTEMLALGSTSYAAGLFVLPLEQEFGLSRAAASASIPISFAGAALMAPLVGYLLDRVSVPRMLALGAFLLAAGFTIISFASSLWIMALALFLPIGFGGMAVGPLTTSTLTSRWFYKRRGRALGIASVATSGGGIIVVPLLALAIDAYGWRTALLIESVVIVAIVWCLCAFVIASGPADLGLQDHPENEGRPPSDMPLADGAERKSGPAAWRYLDILMNMNFWATAFIIASISGIAQAIVTTVVPYAQDTLLFSRPASAALISGFAVCAAVMKILAGLLADYIDRRLIMIAGAIAMSAALGMLLTFVSYPALFIACCLAGIGLGCVLPTCAAQIAATFGSPSFGKVMGMVYVAIVLGSISTVFFAGAMYDRFRNYDVAFNVLLAVALAGILAAALIRIPGKSAEKIGAA